MNTLSATLSDAEYNVATVLEVSDYAPCGRLPRAQAEAYVRLMRDEPVLKLYLHYLRLCRAQEIEKSRWEETEHARGLWLAIRVFSVLLAEREEAEHGAACKAAS